MKDLAGDAVWPARLPVLKADRAVSMSVGAATLLTRGFGETPPPQQGDIAQQGRDEGALVELEASRHCHGPVICSWLMCE